MRFNRPFAAGGAFALLAASALGSAWRGGAFAALAFAVVAFAIWHVEARA